MNKPTATFLVTAAFAAGLIAGCSIKPPTDGQELGPEVSMSTVNQALTDAQKGLDLNKDYRLNDRGIVQLTSRVFASSAVRETYEYQVTSVTAKEIIYAVLDKGTGEVTAYKIDKTQATAAKPSTEKGSLVARLFKKAYNKISKFVASVRISPSTALGQNPGSDERPQAFPNEVSHRILEKHFRSTLAKAEGRALKPSELSPTATTSRFFGLKVVQHKLLTSNCSQIPGCRVNATKIEFDELVKDDTGAEKRVHRLYEISVEVPGLFAFMDECVSSLVNQDENQYPLTECVHVSDFVFGNAN